jgi:hypothetical protein
VRPGAAQGLPGRDMSIGIMFGRHSPGKQLATAETLGHARVGAGGGGGRDEYWLGVVHWCRRAGAHHVVVVRRDTTACGHGAPRLEAQWLLRHRAAAALFGRRRRVGRRLRRVRRRGGADRRVRQRGRLAWQGDAIGVRYCCRWPAFIVEVRGPSVDGTEAGNLRWRRWPPRTSFSVVILPWDRQWLMRPSAKQDSGGAGGPWRAARTSAQRASRSSAWRAAPTEPPPRRPRQLVRCTGARSASRSC